MNWPSYLIQVNIYLVLFYAFYMLVLQNETFFKWNRIYLIGSGVFSFLIPVMQSEWVKNLFVSDEIIQVTQIIYPLNLNEVSIAPQVAEQGFSAYQWFALIYVLGVFIFSIRFVLQLLQVSKSFNKDNQAHSFFKKIKVSDNIPSRDSIVKHEEIHASQLHSADVIFFELLSIINWFNPIVYTYKKAIKYIHEFIADDAASEETGKSDYALLLVSNVFGIKKEQLTNNFYNQSLLKKRIMMLHKSKSKKIALLKYGLSVPLFGAMLVFSSATISKNEISLLKSELADFTKTVPLKEKDAALDKQHIPEASKTVSLASNILSTLNEAPASIESVKDTSGIYSTASIEVMPEYPGGIDKFLQWFGKNYKYPDAAKAAGVSGRIIVQFVVEKDGTLSNFKVPRDLGYGIGDAAKELLSQSLKWKPGIQNGRTVRVQYTLPLTLRASEDQKSPAESLKLGADTIKVRANGTTTGKNPLIIIDGKILDKPMPNGFSIGKDEKATNEYLGILPKDMESITVLKDASAVEKYGEKGKNGVLIIITKSGNK